MATGWRRQNGLELNTGVEAQEDAQITGGEVYLNIPNRSLDVIPAADGSGAIVHMSVPLPDGVGFDGQWIETTHGWKREMDNGWLYRLLNLQSIKVPQALSAYAANGAMFVFDHIQPSDLVVDPDGYTRPKELHFDVTNGQKSSYVATIHPALTQQEIDDGDTRPDHMVGGIVIRHKDKRNNNGKANYMTGKFLEIPAPLMVAWDSNNNYIGHFFGTYEDLGGGKFVKAYHVQDALADLGPAQDIAYLSVSADIGYTADAATKSSGLANFLYRYASPGGIAGTGYIAPEDGTIESMSIRTLQLLTGANNMHMAAYKNVGGAGGLTVLAETALNEDADSTSGSGPYWNTKAASGSFLSGDEIILAFDPGGSGPDMYYDANVGQGGVSNLSHTSNTAVPDPSSMGLPPSISREYAAYLTYAAAATTPVTTNVIVDPSAQTRGDDVAISADIASDNTITAAEYFYGVDPGEGSGTAMTLTPSSGTSVEATATLDTTDIVSGAYTMSVRGFDAVGGWGAVGTDAFTISLPVVQDFTATGGDEVVNLTWTDEPDIYTDGYTIIWDVVSPPVTNVIVTGNAGFYEHTGRVNGQEIFYTIQGEDPVALSPKTSVVSATPVAPAIVGGEGIANTDAIIGNGGISG